MRYERSIRALPAILVVVSVIDLIKQITLFLSLWQADRVIAETHGPSEHLAMQVFFGVIERVLGIIIYPLGWLTSAAILIVLLSIYDKGRLSHA